MKINDVSAFETMFKGASDIADAAIAIENKELCLATLTFMSDFMYSMGIVVPEMFAELDYKRFFGESAYDSITVERNKNGSFTARFYKKFNDDVCKTYGIAPVLERTAVGDSYDNACSHVMAQISNWLEFIKAKTGLSSDSRPIVTHQDQDPDIEARYRAKGMTPCNNDTDEGLFKATEGCCGNCAACDHEVEE